MIKPLRRLIYAMSITLFATAFLMTHTSAQSNKPPANGFRISPVRSEYTIDKGKSQKFSVTVENPSDSPTTARAVVNDFIAADDESGEPRLILDDNVVLPKNDFKKLVATIPDTSLAAREKKNIDVTVAVPSDARSGGYYGAIRFVPIAPGSDTKNVGLTASVGTIVLIRVPGNLTERLDLVQLSAASKKTKEGATIYTAKNFFTDNNVTILTRLKNSGDIHLQPFGKIQVKNMFGKVVNEFEFNNTDPRANILPDSTRRFVNDQPKLTQIGRYTIEANLGYTQGSGNLISVKASFWYIPMYAIYGFIAAVVVIIGMVYWLIYRRKSHRRHRR